MAFIIVLSGCAAQPLATQQAPSLQGDGNKIVLVRDKILSNGTPLIESVTVSSRVQQSHFFHEVVQGLQNHGWQVASLNDIREFDLAGLIVIRDSGAVAISCASIGRTQKTPTARSLLQMSEGSAVIVAEMDDVIQRTIAIAVETLTGQAQFQY